MSVTRRGFENKELTKPNKQNSLDLMDTWAMINSTDEMLEIAKDEGNLGALGEYDESEFDTIYSQNEKTIIPRSNKSEFHNKKFMETLEEVKRLIDSGEYKVVWYDNYVTLKKIDFIDDPLYPEYFEIKKNYNINRKIYINYINRKEK